VEAAYNQDPGDPWDPWGPWDPGTPPASGLLDYVMYEDILEIVCAVDI